MSEWNALCVVFALVKESVDAAAMQLRFMRARLLQAAHYQEKSDGSNKEKGNQKAHSKHPCEITLGEAEDG